MRVFFSPAFPSTVTQLLRSCPRYLTNRRKLLPLFCHHPPQCSNSRSNHSIFEDCITAYNDLKLSKKYKYIIYKLSDDNKEIVVEEASADKDWENFRQKLINATTKSKSGAVGKGPRYAVYDFEYSLASGEGERNKITFLAWSPDDAGVMAKMVYASSKEALKRSLTGIATELQANDPDDIEYDSILKTVSKGMAG
ncbi:cofilin [Colletotrichum spaethianum]|uniref:Cofilin n=1 Tax=Colletotrichum spaethianum TaxID=700344 RepID=A0AA37LE47_9PEZI|nr:cofilin [Colletotrichum spaethianum]GKT46976.1 cofilin [Colletotrichum spaethianum]